MHIGLQTSPVLFADQVATTVEESAPPFVPQTNRHPRQTGSLSLAVLDPSVDMAKPLRSLQVSAADAKLTSEFVGIDDPIAQMSHGEPHGVLLHQLGNMCGAEADTSTACEKIRGTITSRSRPERNGQEVRVPGSLGRVIGASGPPERKPCLGAVPQNHLTFTIAGGLMAITTKAALAAELKISKARVSQYVKAGLPVRSDGKLNREQALNWINRTQASQTVADKGVVRARKLASDRPRLLRPPPPPSAYEPEVEVARRIIGGAEAIVAQSAVSAGASLELAYVLSVMVASALDRAASDALAEHGFEGFAKGFAVGELCSVKDFPSPDWTALAKQCGAAFDEDACERRLAQVEAAA